ncbi:MAG: cell division/cell wall cluster transcriptional repressor MraZ [Candidatus Azobacteroides sp.]|nr:cell division/cell wall cluster transcriptional repressor MraZ [Candidatus Azobacteroides sp.]
MLNFLGNIEAKLDNKGRVAIPAQFRKILQTEGVESLVLKKDIFQNCLILYPTSVWDENVAELRSRLNKWNARHQEVLRNFMLDAERVVVDASGRILIPGRYLQLTGITSDIRFLGIDNVIEIWPKSLLEKPLMTPEEFSQEIQHLMSEE